MSAEPVIRTTSDALRLVLLHYLQSNWPVAWPGVDGLTVGDALACYPQAIKAGAVPDWQELCRRHAELNCEIQSLLTSTAAAVVAARHDAHGSHQPNENGEARVVM